MNTTDQDILSEIRSVYLINIEKYNISAGLTIITIEKCSVSPTEVHKCNNKIIIIVAISSIEAVNFNEEQKVKVLIANPSLFHKSHFIWLFRLLEGYLVQDNKNIKYIAKTMTLSHSFSISRSSD